MSEVRVLPPLPRGSRVVDARYAEQVRQALARIRERRAELATREAPGA